MTTTEHVSNRTSPPCVAAGEITKNTSNISRPDPRPCVYFVYSVLLIISVFWFAVTIGTTNAYASETEKYHGKILLEGHHPGYDPGRGSCLSDGPTVCPLGLTGSEIVAKNGNKIQVIWLTSNTGNRDAKGHTIWRIEDTIEFPSDYKGTFETEPGGCISSTYPDATIIAKGKWHNRKPPKVGGFMRPIEKAWRVDFKTRKFVEISTKGVVCELNEDRD